MPGWGPTSERWITQFEWVTADCEIRLCNRDENADIFWAGRGAGMGFFGIVTKFWARTIPAKKVYHLDWVFSIDNYEKAINWALDVPILMQPHLKYLHEHASQPKYVYTVKWENAGDLIIWDNTCVIHRATHGDFEGEAEGYAEN